ncbi:MAG: hypothetical protein ABIJ57_00220 [Pseudomonadota bacterium]
MMSEHKYKKGDILRHKLTRELVIVLRLLYEYGPMEFKYKVRKIDYDFLDILEEELEVLEPEGLL